MNSFFRSYPVPGAIRIGLGAFRRWLRSRQPDPQVEWNVAARSWGDPKWSLLCVVALLGTLAMPPDGIGVRFCLFYQVSGLDCPGCGMTRGLSHVWRGELLEAFRLHFFALPMFLFLVFQSASLFLPKPHRNRAMHWIDRHDLLFRRLWMTGGVVFFLYGGLRIAYELFERNVSFTV